MPMSDLAPQQTSSTGSATADAVVVGGGLVGICSALYLQRTGRDVTLVERQTPGAAASGHNGGVFGTASCVPFNNLKVLRSVPRMLVDPYSPLALRWSYVPRLVPWFVRFGLASRPARVEQISVALTSLIDRSLGDYEALLSGTAAEGFTDRGGLLYAYRDEKVFEGDHSSFGLRARRGVVFEKLDQSAIGRLDPALWGRFQHAYHVPGAWFTTDPEEMARELAAQLVAGGGRVEQADVYGFDKRGGVVDAVVTTRGRIPAGTVVIAAGAWSRRLTRILGVDFPLDTERGYGIDLPDPGITLRMPVIVQDNSIALSPHRGGIRVTGINEFAGLQAPPDFRLVERAVDLARQSFPELRVDGGLSWMSYRPSLPDSLPVIGRAPRHTNVFLAFGHGHTGMGQAAVTGRLVQEVMDDKPTSVDLHPFRPERFSLLRRGRR
jgi:D-amino-acid dehydrogenase